VKLAVNNLAEHAHIDSFFILKRIEARNLLKQYTKR